jgi:hypothetical protein
MTDRATQLRRDIEWVFGLRLFVDKTAFDRIEELIREALAEAEVDVRREHSTD